MPTGDDTMPDISRRDMTPAQWEPRAGGRFLIYMGPHLKENLDLREVRRIMHGRNACGALWTYDFDNGREGPFYSVVCDDPSYDLTFIRSANVRQKIRRCLKRCEVGRIEPLVLADKGYRILVSTASRYAHYRVQSEEKFREGVDRLAQRSNVEILGVTQGCELIAYGVFILCDDTVRVGATKFDPAYSSSMPMYGLYYSAARHFLQREYRLIDNGTRPLTHRTNICDFLEAMDWRRAYCRLGMHLKPWFKLGLTGAQLTGWAWRRWLPPAQVDTLEGLLEARAVARATMPDTP